MALTLTEENGIYKFKGRTFKQTEEKKYSFSTIKQDGFQLWYSVRPSADT